MAAAFDCVVHAKIITVTTTDSDHPSPGAVSLAGAIAALEDGDTIQFNLSGAGPFLLPTPVGGYPLITQNNVTIDGFSQTGAKPNTHPILAANNAKIQIVLDSRNGNVSSMSYDPANPYAGFGDTEFAILGVFRGTNVAIRGLSLLAPPLDPNGVNNNYGIAFAADEDGTPSGGHISGCWIGVAPDGVTLAGTTYAIPAFRHRDSDGQNPVDIDNLTIGVAKGSTNARAEFNVIVPSALPIVLEGQGHRISGNFLGVLPDGVTEVNVALDTENWVGNNQSQGQIQIGRAGNNTVIGTDGDGVNDADERNVMSGTLPPDLNGYDHSIEFYGNNPGTNIVVAGNYIGVGVDGLTRFTNGAPVLNAGGADSTYCFGSNLDGTSDAIEGNFVINNWPPGFFADHLNNLDPADLGFFDQLSTGSTVSARANRLVDNLPFPVSPIQADSGVFGNFWQDYYAQALLHPAGGVTPTLDPASTTTLISGTIPAATSAWPTVYIDLYLTDREGLTNGLTYPSPGLTNGWVQGKAFLGAFQVDGPADLNAATGAFTFAIDPLDLPAEASVTITANYIPQGGGLALTSPFAAPVSLAGSYSLQIAPTQGQLTISWPAAAMGYRLQSTTHLLGGWQDVSGVVGNAYTIAPGNAAAFYRLKQ